MTPRHKYSIKNNFYTATQLDLLLNKFSVQSNVSNELKLLNRLRGCTIKSACWWSRNKLFFCGKFIGNITRHWVELSANLRDATQL